MCFQKKFHATSDDLQHLVTGGGDMRSCRQHSVRKAFINMLNLGPILFCCSPTMETHCVCLLHHHSYMHQLVIQLLVCTVGSGNLTNFLPQAVQHLVSKTSKCCNLLKNSPICKPQIALKL
jgi:hypothetical protein